MMTDPPTVISGTACWTMSRGPRRQGDPAGRVAADDHLACLGSQGQLIGRYGRDYRDDYGWAAGLIQLPLTFAGLEAKADMNYLRFLYVTGSHLIHASAHGMTLTIPGQNDAATLTLTGPSDTGLAQPAQASLNALIAVTGALIEHGPVPDNAGLVATFLALHALRIRTIILLNQAEDRAVPPTASRPGEPRAPESRPTCARQGH
jgi:hypothetical protein